MDYMGTLKTQLTTSMTEKQDAPAPQKKEKKPKTKKYDVETYKSKPRTKSYAEKVIENVYKDKLPPWERKCFEEMALAFPSEMDESMRSTILLEGGDDDSFNNSNA
jgi:hypothetical protein